jgi:hypothetical protein
MKYDLRVEFENGYAETLATDDGCRAIEWLARRSATDDTQPAPTLTDMLKDGVHA